MKLILYKIRDIAEKFQMTDRLKLKLDISWHTGNTLNVKQYDFLKSSDWKEFFARFWDFGFYYDESDTPLEDVFECWLDNNHDSLERMCSAFLAVYDPLANYDKYSYVNSSGSAVTNAKSSTEAESGSQSDSRQGHESMAGGLLSFDSEGTLINLSDTGVKNKVSQKTAPYNAGTKLDGETETEGTTADRTVMSATSKTNADTSTKTSSDTQSTDRAETHEFGNIGVQTAADIAEKEISLRSHTDIVQTMLKMFAEDTLFMGVWD